MVYAVTLVLNLVELVAMCIVYLGLFDIIEEICVGEFEDVEVETKEDQKSQFASVDECIYNIRFVAVMVIVVGSLIYFPLKFHFALVIRAYYKQKRD